MKKIKILKLLKSLLVLLIKLFNKIYEKIEINPVIKFIKNLIDIKEIIEIIKEIIFKIKVFIEKYRNFFEKPLIFSFFLFFTYEITKIIIKNEKKDSIVCNFCIGSFAFVMGFFSYISFFHFLTYKMNLVNFLNSFSVTEYWMVLFIMFIIHFLSLKYFIYNNQKMKWLKKDYKRYFLLIPEILLIFFPFNHLLFVVN